MTTKLPINPKDLICWRTVEAVHADTMKILLYMRDFRGGLKLTKRGKAP